MSYTQSTGIGLRAVYMAIRDEDGTIQVPATVAAGTAYPGLKVSRAKALSITPAEPQRVQARGDDVGYHTFSEAPTDQPSGELRVQQSDTELIALITNTKEFGSGNMSMVALASDKLGSEDPVFIWGSRKAIDSEPGNPNVRVWETYILLNAQAFARPQGFEDQQIGEFSWSIVCNNSAVDQFGRTMTEAIHGCTEAAYLMVKTKNPFFIDAFVGNGSQATFTLTKGSDTVYNTPTSPVWVFIDGVQDTTATVSDAGVLTPTSVPGDGAKLICQYEHTL